MSQKGWVPVQETGLYWGVSCETLSKILSCVLFINFKHVGFLCLLYCSCSKLDIQKLFPAVLDIQFVHYLSNHGFYCFRIITLVFLYLSCSDQHLGVLLFCLFSINSSIVLVPWVFDLVLFFFVCFFICAYLFLFFIICNYLLLFVCVFIGRYLSH